MFYHNLNGTFLQNLTGNQTVGTITLNNIAGIYWSGTEYNLLNAGSFAFINGLQFYPLLKINPGSAWAVRDGDTATAVLEPATLTLIGFGLAGLIGRRRFFMGLGKGARLDLFR